jgi:short-subunit dehydrogenase
MAEFSSIVITGASSGIGEALARDYARPGATLALTGRDAARLEAVAAACRARGARVHAETIDVTESERLAAWLLGIDAETPVDLLIANAGISIDKRRGTIDPEIVRQTFAVNVDGVFNTVLPLIPRLQARRGGQIAIVSSLAGFLGLPRGGAYSASKAAVRVWGEGLRYALRRDGVGVSVVCPGFVTSRMTEGNDFPMPFLMNSARASAIIRRGLARNAARIAFPWPTRGLVWLAEVMPASLLAGLLSGYRGRPA